MSCFHTLAGGMREDRRWHGDFAQPELLKTLRSKSNGPWHLSCIRDKRTHPLVAQDRRAEVAAAVRPHLPALATGLAALLRGPFAKPDRLAAAAGAAAGAASALARLLPGEPPAMLLGAPGASELSAAADEAGAQGPSQKVTRRSLRFTFKSAMQCPPLSVCWALLSARCVGTVRHMTVAASFVRPWLMQRDCMCSRPSSFLTALCLSQGCQSQLQVQSLKHACVLTLRHASQAANELRRLAKLLAGDGQVPAAGQKGQKRRQPSGAAGSGPKGGALALAEAGPGAGSAAGATRSRAEGNVVHPALAPALQGGQGNGAQGRAPAQAGDVSAVAAGKAGKAGKPAKGSGSRRAAGDADKQGAKAGKAHKRAETGGGDAAAVQARKKAKAAAP